jgi:hypothetical protein
MKDAALPMHDKDFVLENGSPGASGSMTEIEPGQKKKERRRIFWRRRCMFLLSLGIFTYRFID